ncbi:MAG: hypothetical protein KDD58_08270 [Bdellovibrionales bacterium]|nr:hypothetical protein [Bdellovibrionales bacterium]
MCKSIKSSLNLNKSINVRIPSGFSNYLHYHENLDNIINKYEGYKILPDNKDFVSTIYFIENNVSISCLMYNQALKTKNKFPIVFQNMKKCDLNILLDLTI